MTKPSIHKKITIHEIARISGLSTATIDRVLNQRPGVRESTRLRVEAAIAQSQQAQQQELATQRIAFIIEAGSSFAQTVREAMEQLQTYYPRISFSFDSVPGYQFDPASFCPLIAARSAEADAIILVSRDHVQVNSEVRKAISNGVPVIALVTDLPSASAYVGVDEVSAGANAALFIGRMARSEAKKLLFVASATYRCQEEREMGFRRVIRSDFPGLEIEETFISNDESDKTYALMTKFLAKNPGTVGIYNSAGGNRGIARAIKEAQLAQDIVFVGHDLTEHTQKLLEQGDMDVVFSYDMKRVVKQAIDIASQPLEKISSSRIILPLITYTRYSWFGDINPL
ncbi:LacI family DNA-binding transcriptional regulator [Candidatus Pantoea multigeneris]|uniref:Substrate-binding domain-containing protein n=1 Tax=Candidatus Pantoea multigeneris TaxID=2608357 RepID=A0ABX0R9Y2_9GAMM|nr:LacI family DNA-binding transcriptional regulator [Pantoea multigeneris]NIF22175.1 substrate-binding domain-containing protein [Pantoea multigeneris]